MYFSFAPTIPWLDVLVTRVPEWMAILIIGVVGTSYTALVGRSSYCPIRVPMPLVDTARVLCTMCVVFRRLRIHVICFEIGCNPLLSIRWTQNRYWRPDMFVVGRVEWKPSCGWTHFKASSCWLASPCWLRWACERLAASQTFGPSQQDTAGLISFSKVLIHGHASMPGYFYSHFYMCMYMYKCTCTNVHVHVHVHVHVKIRIHRCIGHRLIAFDMETWFYSYQSRKMWEDGMQGGSRTYARRHFSRVAFARRQKPAGHIPVVA